VKTATKQTAWELRTDAEEQAEIEAGYIWRASLWSAMRTFATNYIGPSGMRGLAAVAAELDKRWGGDAFGRPVSESTLGAALRDAERNYFRLEWVDWFAARSPEIADLLARRVKPVKTIEQYVSDLEAEIAAEVPRRAEAVKRNARAR
jgi:hypothetical protein